MACSGVVHEAKPMFEKFYPGHKIREVDKFLKDWYGRLEDTDAYEDLLKDRPGRGRKVRLDDHAADKCATAFAKGWRSNSKRKSFGSIEEVGCRLPRGRALSWRQPTPLPWRHTQQPTTSLTGQLAGCLQACKKNKYLRDLVAQGHSPLYLWRRAKQRDPKLTMKLETLKPEYTEEEKQRRYEFALQLLQQPPEFLRSIVWLDESSVAINPKRSQRIGRKGEDLLSTDRRVVKDKRQIQYIHYLLAVCYAHGLVRLSILSYTKGFDNPIQYYVSAAACLCSPARAPFDCACHSWGSI